MTFTIYIILTSLGFLGFMEQAIAQGNLVYNGGFEISSNGVNTDGWSGENGVSAGGNPGRFVLLYGPVMPTCSQTISGLVPGDSYIVSGDYELWKNPDSNVSTPSFGVAFDDVFLFETAAPTNSLVWQSFSSTYTAVSPSADLSISAQLNGVDASYGIDNIAMYATPEPSFAWLLFLGSGIVFHVRRTRKTQ